eukprot:TRINITY_DN62246_c0_g1_i1.p1 TRINITY_DN62246_c0_g1~~TRINITY_DN62246_c0_g1_i1.p1  ORF type:complete len:235 (-),score=29.37 TRINITY_DN62246_c0_g1_i1:421-1125(-)
MASKNAVEAVTGASFTSAMYWDKHPLVGLSSICFGVPASTFFAVDICLLRFVPRPWSTETLVQFVLYGVLSVQYVVVVATCALADYVYIRRAHRSTYGRVDIVVATIAFLTSVLDFWLRASIAETILLASTAVAAFVFSGLSKSHEQWVFRHSLWHLVAGSVGTYGSLRLPPEGDRISENVWHWAAGVACAYLASVFASLLLFFFLVPPSSRLALWDWGAHFAAWRPVTPLSEQ